MKQRPGRVGGASGAGEEGQRRTQSPGTHQANVVSVAASAIRANGSTVRTRSCQARV